MPTGNFSRNRKYVCFASFTVDARLLSSPPFISLQNPAVAKNSSNSGIFLFTLFVVFELSPFLSNWLKRVYLDIR